jgi:hypothetical protein
MRGTVLPSEVPCQGGAAKEVAKERAQGALAKEAKEVPRPGGATQVANLEAIGGGARAAGFAGDGAENSLRRGRVATSRGSPSRREVGLRAGWPEFGRRRRSVDTPLPR